MAMSTAPDATRAALPELEPPEERVVSHGFRTGPLALVWLPPEKHRSSQTDLPATVPPAARILVTTVASSTGTKPSSEREPFIIGRPATMTLSLMATRLLASGPLVAPVISAVTYQPLSGLSAGSGVT